MEVESSSGVSNYALFDVATLHVQQTASVTDVAVDPVLPGAIDQVGFRDERPIPHRALPIADTHVLDIHDNDPDCLASYEMGSALLITGGRSLLEDLVFLKCVVLKVLVYVVFLLLRAGRGQSS